jgi:hypothetical protein
MNHLSTIEFRAFVLWPLAAAAIVAPFIHCFVRRFWFACLWSVAIACTLSTVASLLVWFSSDLPWAKLVWLPRIFAENASVALPVSALVGLPYYLLRRRHHDNAA